MKPLGKYLCVAAFCAATSVLAHGDEDHSKDGANASPVPELKLPAAVTPLPWDVGGSYSLTDQNGKNRTQADPEGKLQLVFFGYANCPGICSAAMPTMGQVVDVLASRGIDARPVMITIDPKLDTVDSMGPKLSEFSPEFVGLTGTPEELQVAYDAFQVTFEHIMDDPEYGPIYSHGSYIYLLNGEGDVQTLMPPILPATQMADIVARYATPEAQTN